jgi:transposase-like protein
VDIVIISDRHKGLNSEVKSVFLSATHGHCAHHVFSNMMHACKDRLLKRYYWLAAKTCKNSIFEELTRSIALANPSAYHWLSNIDKDRWESSFFQGKRHNI